MVDHPDNHIFILPTKIHPPQQADWAVKHSHLVDRLTESSAHRLTLISAPAGFGKTMLVSQWLQVDTRPIAWLSLDAHDNDLTPFVTYLTAAVRVSFPEFGRKVEGVIASGITAKPSRLADFFLAELFALDDPLHIVLDDYHASIRVRSMIS